MASTFAAFFGGSDALPARIEPLRRGKDVHLEIFVDAAVTEIYNQASARSKEQRAIKEACKHLLGARVCCVFGPWVSVSTRE